MRQWCTYYGGTDYDLLSGISVTDKGDVLVSGNTLSTSGIATSNGYQQVNGGLVDIYMAIFTLPVRCNMQPITVVREWR